MRGPVRPRLCLGRTLSPWPSLNRPPPLSQDLSSFMELGPSGPCGPVGSRLMPCSSLPLTVREFLPTTSHCFQCLLCRDYHHLPLALDAYSILQVPPSQLWGIKGSPTAASWGMEAPGPRQRAGTSQGENPSGFQCQSWFYPWYFRGPFPSGSAFPSSAAAWRRHLVSGMSMGSPGTLPHPLPSKRKWEARTCCFEGGSLGCSTLPLC